MGKAQSVKLTKSVIDRLPLPPPNASGQAQQTIYRDAGLGGFGLLVGTGGTKSFFVERRVNGRVKRISLGRYGHLTPTQARSRAQDILGQIAVGKDPSAERRASAAKAMTLAAAFEDYLKTRSDLKPGTVKNYRKCVEGCLDDWQRRRLVDITKDMVQTRHRDISSHAPARANNAMRVLRAIFNHAMAKYERADGRPLIEVNPVDRLGQVRAWNAVERRQSLLATHQLRPWWNATLKLNEFTTRDYLHFLLYTGLRKMEAASLHWDQVDFKAETITIIDTKNRAPHVLPFSDFLSQLLKERRAQSAGDWVFESPMNPGTHLREPRSAVARVATLCQHPFALHDLRRTFITVAESLDIPYYALKRLLNHRDSNDVTAGYIINNVERLRVPMAKIAAHLDEHARGLTPPSNQEDSTQDVTR